MSDTGVNLMVRMKRLCTWKCPLCLARWVRTKSGSVSRMTYISDNKVFIRKTLLKLGLEIREVNHPLSESVTEDNQVFAFFNFKR